MPCPPLKRGTTGGLKRKLNLKAGKYLLGYSDLNILFDGKGYGCKAFFYNPPLYAQWRKQHALSPFEKGDHRGIEQGIEYKL